MQYFTWWWEIHDVAAVRPARGLSAMHDASRHVTAPARRLPSVPRVSPMFRGTKRWWVRKIVVGMNKPLSLTFRSWARRPRSAIPRLRESAARIVTKEMSAQTPGPHGTRWRLRSFFHAIVCGRKTYTSCV